MARREYFEQNGFVTVPGFCEPDEVEKLLRALDAFIDEDLNGLPREHVFLEDISEPESLKQIQKLHTHSSFFDGWMNDRPKKLAAELLGEPVRAVNLQYFNKAPGRNQPTPPHQDGYYFMLNPCAAVTHWLALDPVDEENGCIRYVPGSNCHGLRQHHQTGTLGFSQGIDDYGADDLELERMCPAQPGDLLAHHAYTIHRADGNGSAHRQRRALGCIFYGESAREDAAAHAAYQELLSQKMKAAGRI